MIGAAVRHLRGGQVQQTLAGARMIQQDESQQILVGVAETHAAPDAAFERRSRAGNVESRHHLINIPDIDHAIGVLIRALHLETLQQAVPIDFQFRKSLLHFPRLQETLYDRQDFFLVDHLRVRWVEFSVSRVFLISQQEDDPPAFTRL